MESGVITSVYGTERFWADRADAVSFYESCALYSSGEELSNYLKVLKDLKAGYIYVSDVKGIYSYPFSNKVCSRCGAYSSAPDWTNTCISCGKKWSLKNTKVNFRNNGFD